MFSLFNGSVTRFLIKINFLSDGGIIISEWQYVLIFGRTSCFVFGQSFCTVLFSVCNSWSLFVTVLSSVILSLEKLLCQDSSHIPVQSFYSVHQPHAIKLVPFTYLTVKLYFWKFSSIFCNRLAAVCNGFLKMLSHSLWSDCTSTSLPKIFWWNFSHPNIMATFFYLGRVLVCFSECLWCISHWQTFLNQLLLLFSYQHHNLKLVV